LQQTMTETWFTFHVDFEGETYPLGLKLSHDVPVPAVKEMMVEHLKKFRPSQFGSIDLDIGWLILKTCDDEKGIGEEINDMRMPQGKINFSAQIVIPLEFQNSKKSEQTKRFFVFGVLNRLFE
jgi:hypothetical protein